MSPLEESTLPPMSVAAAELGTVQLLQRLWEGK